MSHKTDTDKTGQTKFITITCAHSCPLSSLHQHHLHLPESAEFHTQCCTATGKDTFHHSLFTVLQQILSAHFTDSAVILAMSVSKHCSLDLAVVKAQGSIAGLLFFLPVCILDPRPFAFLTARRLWGTLRKRSQNLAMRVPQRMLIAKSKWRVI